MPNARLLTERVRPLGFNRNCSSCCRRKLQPALAPTALPKQPVTVSIRC